MLYTIACAFLALQHERVAGLMVRRVRADPELPWVYEADWQRHQASACSVIGHDPLASCYWPASLPLARLLGSRELAGFRVCELGCGTGMCSLTAAASGATVLATDIDPLALSLTAAAAAVQHLSAVTQAFDVLDTRTPVPPTDILVLSDVFVTSSLARAHARRVGEALDQPSLRCVLVVDPCRTTRNDFLDELAAIGVRHEGFRPIDDVHLMPDGTLSPIECRRQELVLLSTNEGQAVWYDI